MKRLRRKQKYGPSGHSEGEFQVADMQVKYSVKRPLNWFASIVSALGYVLLVITALLLVFGGGKLAGIWFFTLSGGVGFVWGASGIRSGSRSFIMALLIGNGVLIALGVFYATSAGIDCIFSSQGEYLGWPLLGLIVIEIFASPLAFPDPIETLSKK